MAKKALVTVLIGDKVTAEWNVFFRASWERYAEKHDYDIITITRHLDDSPRGLGRTANWQKLLIMRDPRVQQYDDVVWMDSDLLINYNSAPCIVGSHNSAKVGLVSNRNAYFLSPEKRDNLLDRMVAPRKYSFEHIYKAAELPPGVEDYSNTGVMVLKPKEHTVHLEYVYDNFEENPGSAKEESPLSYSLYKNDLVQPIDPRFNRCWIYEVIEKYPLLLSVSARENQILMICCTTAAWANSYFTHFTGDWLSKDGKGVYQMRQDVRFVDQNFHNVLAFSQL